MKRFLEKIGLFSANEEYEDKGYQYEALEEDDIKEDYTVVNSHFGLTPDQLQEPEKQERLLLKNTQVLEERLTKLNKSINDLQEQMAWSSKAQIFFTSGILIASIIQLIITIFG